MQRELVQLPNKDLYRAPVVGEAPPPADIVVKPEEQHPMDRAMAAVLAFAAGAQTLTCPWCGLQGDEKYMRDHLRANHPSVVTPPDYAAQALADAARAEAELAAAAPTE